MTVATVRAYAPGHGEHGPLGSAVCFGARVFAHAHRRERGRGLGSSTVVRCAWSDDVTALTRGTCAVCGREVALRRSGLVREHRPFNVERDSGREIGLGGATRPSGVCRGSGLTARVVCRTCDGDGYTETWNDDQSDVVITLCPDCQAGAA